VVNPIGFNSPPDEKGSYPPRIHPSRGRIHFTSQYSLATLNSRDGFRVEHPAADLRPFGWPTRRGIDVLRNLPIIVLVLISGCGLHPSSQLQTLAEAGASCESAEDCCVVRDPCGSKAYALSEDDFQQGSELASVPVGALGGCPRCASETVVLQCINSTCAVSSFAAADIGEEQVSIEELSPFRENRCGNPAPLEAPYGTFESDETEVRVATGCSGEDLFVQVE
jgi:hypothetical protein